MFSQLPSTPYSIFWLLMSFTKSSKYIMCILGLIRYMIKRNFFFGLSYRMNYFKLHKRVALSNFAIQIFYTKTILLGIINSNF